MKKTYRLENLDCASCAAKMEDGIRQLPGIDAASVNFLTSKLTIETSSDDSGALEKQIKAIVRKIEPDCDVIG
jgi:cation transport ATPase